MTAFVGLNVPSPYPLVMPLSTSQSTSPWNGLVGGTSGNWWAAHTAPPPALRAPATKAPTTAAAMRLPRRGSEPVGAG